MEIQETRQAERPKKREYTSEDLKSPEIQRNVDDTREKCSETFGEAVTEKLFFTQDGTQVLIKLMPREQYYKDDRGKKGNLTAHLYYAYNSGNFTRAYLGSSEYFFSSAEKAWRFFRSQGYRT
jgi:hypothetical protein